MEENHIQQIAPRFDALISMAVQSDTKLLIQALQLQVEAMSLLIAELALVTHASAAGNRGFPK